MATLFQPFLINCIHFQNETFVSVLVFTDFFEKRDWA